MAKIYKKIKICNELKDRVKNEVTLVPEIISLSGTRENEIIKIHSWRDGDVDVKISDIIFIHSLYGNSFIYTESGLVLVHRRALSFYQNLFQNKLFVRVHQSYLVNQVHILGITADKEQKLLLSNNAKIPVSKQFGKINYEVIRNSVQSNN